MQPFDYKNDELYVEEVRLKEIAECIGTPCYVYSRSALQHRITEFQNAFGKARHRICYAVKANSNLAVLSLFAQHHFGFDIVSQGELERVLVAKGDPKKIVFSGVGKQIAEINRAIEVGVGCFNVESEQELKTLQVLAQKANTILNVALRINPNIHAKTHPHIATGLYENKFGIDYANALGLSIKTQLMHNLKLVGIACHIGSQITTLNPFLEAMDRMVELIKDLHSAEITLEHINIGGGLGVRYQNEVPPTVEDYVSEILKKLSQTNLEIIIEPGRSLTAHAGALLTRVVYLKSTQKKNFAIVDAGMNDFIRPALYDAWHDVLPVHKHLNLQSKNYDIVGPVCESADYLGKDRELALLPDDLLAILSVGAYGSCMSSNYNSRPRPAEVMVDGDQLFLIRKREQITDLFSLESLILTACDNQVDSNCTLK